MTKVIKEVRTGTLTQELIFAVDNRTKLENALAAVSYGALQQYATVEYSIGRRLLSEDRRELATSVPMEITFEVSEELYALLDGLGFDDDAFEQALANELGIELNSTDVFIGSGSNVITIEATLSADPDGIDPLAATLIDSANELQDIMETIILNLVQGAGNVYVVNTSVNLCPAERTCYYHGTCNSNTGVCACVGNWWGINCETPCECINQGDCVNAYCVCVYPWYGLRCHEGSVCSDEICPT